MASVTPMRILYIEDDRALARLVRQVLEQAGYEVALAYDGADGLVQCAVGGYDLLLCDFDLPGYNGLDVVRRLHAKGKSLPILMVTGSGDEVVALQALEMGVADYIVKDSKGIYLKLLPVVIRHLVEQHRLRTAKEEAEKALARNDERHRDLVEITGDCIWEIDAQGICTYVSPKVEALLGRQPAEILGSGLFTLLEPSEAFRVLRRLGRMIRQREPIRNFQTIHHHQQGHLVVLETSAVPILDAEGRCVGYRGIDRDVTTRRQAEESLRLSEQKFRGVVDNIAMGIALVNRSLEVTFCNKQMREWFPGTETSSSPICYKFLRDPPREAACQGCPAVRAFESGEVRDGVQEVTCGKESRYYRIISSPIRDEQSQVVAAINLVDDVTEQRRAEKALEESERLLRNVLDANRNLIFAKDDAGRYVLANDAMAALYGTTPSAMLGKTDDDFAALGSIPPQVAARLRRDDIQVSEEQRVLEIPEERVEMPDGSIRWFQTRKSPLAVGASQRCVLGVAVEITERKRMEQDLAQAQKLEAVGQLAAGIAHEINTPIQYIGDNTRFLLEAFQGFGDLLTALERLLEACKAGTASAALVTEMEETLQQSDVDYYAEEVPRAVMQSLDGVERVARIVRAIKEFAHPGSEEKQAIDLNRAVENTVTLARNEWKYVAEMVAEFDPHLPLVHCRPSDINQVVLNLIVNAAQAIGEAVGQGTQKKGTIHVSTRWDGPWVEIAVQDTGRGIPEEIHSKIFNPFFTTKEIGKGTGQGLAIAHSLVVEKHGGTISFDTEVGRGTTFYVRLPIDGQLLPVRSEGTAALPGTPSQER